MNPQPDQDLERRLQKLEVEINQTTPNPPVIQTKQRLQQHDIQRPLSQSINWFNGLSGFGKLLVVGVLAFIGLAILQTVLKLVAAVFGLAILAVIVYLIYQFFAARSSETKD